MKYKVGDRTLLGEITKVDIVDKGYPYLLSLMLNTVWMSEAEIDKIIIKPKRNIDHVIELWDEGKRKDAVNYFYNCARFSSAWEDIAILGELYIEPSKDPKLTPEEIKALKLARDCGFNSVSMPNAKIARINISQDDYIYAENIPSFTVLNESTWIARTPMSINELLKDEV